MSHTAGDAKGGGNSRKNRNDCLNNKKRYRLFSKLFQRENLSTSLQNFRSRALNGRSKAADGRSETLNVHSKALNGNFP